MVSKLLKSMHVLVYTIFIRIIYVKESVTKAIFFNVNKSLSS